MSTKQQKIHKGAMMTIRLHLLHNKFQQLYLRCKQQWHLLQAKIHRFLSPLSHHDAESIDEGTTLVAAHWPLDDNHNSIESHKMVIVEVKYYPNDPHTQPNLLTENEDLNLRITHYPPSNRLH